MPTYDELVSAIYVFLQEVNPYIYHTKMGTGGDVKVPSLLFEFANPTRFTTEHREFIDAHKHLFRNEDLGQKAYVAFMNLQELCNRARQYPAESELS
jgi:hypothetical protein